MERLKHIFIGSLIGLFAFTSTHSKAQDFKDRFTYGVRLSAVSSFIGQGKKDTLSPWIGAGASFFSAYDLSPSLNLNLGLGFMSNAYVVDEPYQIIKPNYVQVPVMLKVSPPSFEGSSILFGLNWAQSLNAPRVRTNESSFTDSSNQIYKSFFVDQHASLGIMLGLEFDITKSIALGITYNRQIRSPYYSTHIGGRAHFGQLYLEYEFGKHKWAGLDSKAYEDVLKMKENTIYIVVPKNNTKTNSATVNQVAYSNITKALNQYFKFAPFQILEDTIPNELLNLEDSNKYFVFFGQLFSTSTKTAKLGMYTYSNALDPLPESHYSSLYNQFSNDYFQDPEHVIKMVKMFDKGLSTAYKEYIRSLAAD